MGPQPHPARFSQPARVTSPQGRRGWEPARWRHPFSRWRLLSSCEAEAHRFGRVRRGSRRLRGSEAGGRRARAHARSTWRRSSGVPWVCSRAVLVAEVDERRLVRPKGHGSSLLAPSVSTGGSSRGESAPEAGSRWRKPRAREQRHRWRAPRDPTRSTRKRGTRPGEGALGDGRRPGPAKPSSLTRRRWKAGLAIRSEGDPASRLDPRRVVTEDVRGDVASPARGRKHRDREVQRGGADDRGPARTALCRSRGRSGQASVTRSRAPLRGIT